MIFNRSDNGSSELKKYIGFIYRSINFEDLETYIKLATKDLINLIGKNIYNTAESHYLSDDFNLSGEENETTILKNKLVEQIQVVIALAAYRRYAPGSDLTHSDKGRQIFVSDDEKPAFEWQIVRDNENLLKLEHDHTELLLEFLEENIDNEPIKSTYAVSEAYKTSKKLFVNTVAKFDEVFPIQQSRRLFLALVPFIAKAEEKYLRAYFAADHWETLKELMLDGDFDKQENAEYKKTLLLMVDPICLLALSMAVKRLSIEVLPNSIIKSYTSSDVERSIPAEKNERMEFAKLLEKDAQSELYKLQEHLTSLYAVDLSEPEETEPDYNNKYLSL